MTVDYPNPPLRSERVMLRRWSMDDLACVEAASRAGYSRGSTLPVSYTPEEGTAWIERQWARQKSGTGLSMAIADLETGEAMGMIYLGFRGMQGQAALGYWLVPEVHRRGLGTEAVSIICAWVLRETEIHRLVAYVEPTNTASIALLRKCGFTEEGLLRSFLPLDDDYSDALCFSLLDTDLGDRPTTYVQ